MTRLWGVTAVLTALATVLIGCTAVAQPPIQPTDKPAANPTNPVAIQTTIQPTGRPIMSDLPDLGEAPEIFNEVWINADTPATIASARGKVVLLEFWTFG
ncbi:MAG: hypothetical protein GY803_25395 [Chloroflexi bacterium]|nr:hypothetical protein [Chloroflexota bacterium]